MSTDNEITEQGFDDPPEQEIAEENEDLLEEEEAASFAEPAEEDFEELAEAPQDMDPEYLDVDEALVQIHAEISQQLAQLTTDETGSISSENAFEGSGNIVGVGFGLAGEDSELLADPGEPALNVYVVEPASVDEVKSVIVDSMGISAADNDDVPVNVIVSGIIDADSHRFRMRPAAGGVSVGHYRITAGTLGCLARGRRAPRNRRLLVLSNNHVLANSNNARFGDSVLQPGRYDGGRNPRDRIAILERFVPIRFGGRPNYVDCATAWAWPSRVRRELVYLRGGRRRLFRISRQIRVCRPGMLVGKSGRTTQLTSGRVSDCHATVRVNYGSGRVALFRDQMVIRPLRGRFSAGGDSGSVIWTWDRRRNPVGLLFAGSSSVTIANHMWRVVRALDISLYT